MSKLVLITLFFLFAACSDTPTETQPLEVPDVAATQDIAAMSPPVQSGVVFRGEFPYGVTWVDSDAGLRIAYGFDLVTLCQGTQEFDLLSFQEPRLPLGRTVNRVKGEGQTTVWAFTDFDCGRFTTEAPLASGTSLLDGGSNDLFITGEDNARYFRLQARGTLAWEADGSAARLRASLWLFSPDGDPPFTVDTEIALR